MSPTKLNDPTPPKKGTKAKTPATETKPAAKTTQRKSSKTVDRFDARDAVTDGLTTANSGASEMPAIPTAPKVRRTKTKTPVTDSPSQGSDTKSEGAADKNQPASGAMKAKETPASYKAAKASAEATESLPWTLDAKASAEAKESVPRKLDAKTSESGGDTASKEGDIQMKAPIVGSPPSAGGPETMAHTETAPAEEPGQMASTPKSVPPAVPAASVAQLADKPMELPKGALIAFRKSGGLKFSSREVVVYPDGRVTYDGGDTAKSSLTRAARRMSDAQVVRLRRTLDQINFFGMRPPKSPPDPDGFVIEIAARLGGKNNHVEVNAPGMPGALNSLVDQLTRLLPADE